MRLRLLWWLLLPVATLAAVLPIVTPRASADPRQSGGHQARSTENPSDGFQSGSASPSSSPQRWVPPAPAAWWAPGDRESDGHYGDEKGAVTNWPTPTASTTTPASTADRSASTSGRSTSTTAATSGGVATSDLIPGITLPDVTIPDLTIPTVPVTLPEVPVTLPPVPVTVPPVAVNPSILTGGNQPAPNTPVGTATKPLTGQIKALVPAIKPPVTKRGANPPGAAKGQGSQNEGKGQHGPAGYLASGLPTTAKPPGAKAAPAPGAPGPTGSAGSTRPNWTQTWRKGAKAAGVAAANSPAQNPDGPHAASDAPWQGVSIGSDTPLSVPLIFVMVIAVMMLVAGIVDRRDPKLSKAPRRSNDDYLPFG